MNFKIFDNEGENEKMDKQMIADTCEELYKYCLKQIPQIQNNKIIWWLNGSTLCNILCNIKSINDNLVSKEFTKAASSFVRRPKGDLDICYTDGISYSLDMDSDAIKKFHDICEEKRFAHFIDRNSKIEERHLKQLCLYETNNGLKFYAVAPQYLLLYKFKDFNGLFHDLILKDDIEAILNIKKNSINDLASLYLISSEYIGQDETNSFLYEELKNCSGLFHHLFETDANEYIKTIDIIMQLISKQEILKSI